MLTTDRLANLADQAPSDGAVKRLLRRGYAAQRVRARKRRQETVEVEASGERRPAAPSPVDWWSVTQVTPALLGWSWIAEVKGEQVGAGWAWTQQRAREKANLCVDNNRWR